MDDHERLISILEDQENSCQSHNRTRLVNSYLHHMLDQGRIKDFVIPEDLGSVNGFVEECNSPTRDFITATDVDSLKHEEINQSRTLNNSGTGTTVWNIESIIGENIEIKMSGSLLEHEKVRYNCFF